MSDAKILNSSEIAEQIIKDTKDLPSSPPIAFKLLSLLKKQSQRNEEVVEIIRYDEHLTAKLLKLCNSAYFGSSVPIISIDQAVLRLGYANIASVALSITTGEIINRHKKTPYINPYDLWRHSLTSSVAARILAPKYYLGEVLPDMAFTVALLHDIGKAVLNASPLEETMNIQPLVEEKGISWIEAERAILGTDHAEIGGLLLKKWGLPVDISEAVNYHCLKEKMHLPLAHICRLSSIFAHAEAGTYSLEQLEEKIQKDMSQKFTIEKNDLEDTLSKIKQEASKIQTLMMIA